jgi:hypothetical protein
MMSSSAALFLVTGSIACGCSSYDYESLTESNSAISGSLVKENDGSVKNIGN